MRSLLFECFDIIHDKNKWVQKDVMVLMNNLHFICWKFEAKINTNIPFENIYFLKTFIPFENLYFFNVLTFVKIVPMSNT